MKISLCVFVIILGLTLSSLSICAEENKTSVKHIGVRELMKNPEKFVDEVFVEGVVSRIMLQYQLLALIDIQEVKECKVITCADLVLPVKWIGEMPKLADAVQIKGKIEKENNRMIFKAKDLQKIDEKK